MERMGISYSEKRLRWSPKRGFGRWLSYWIKKCLVAGWNHLACAVSGHTYLCRKAPGELAVCADCTRKVRPTPEQERNVINEW